jgi:hypothetical protein
MVLERVSDGDVGVMAGLFFCYRTRASPDRLIWLPDTSQHREISRGLLHQPVPPTAKRMSSCVIPDHGKFS